MQGEIWTVKRTLDWTVGYLEQKGDEHPRRSAEWLISAATGLSRVELYAYFDRPLSMEERDVLRENVKRRGMGEPLQYVTGEMAFRHLVVSVEPGVLIPRPETETLVELALGHLDDTVAEKGSARVLDISRQPLPGLYAAVPTAGGAFTEYYTGTVAAAGITGRLAANSAADLILG